MPHVVYPSSSDFPAFPAFPPVLREARDHFAISATPLPPPHDFPHFPLVRYPLAKAAAYGRKFPGLPLFDRFSPFSTVFAIAAISKIARRCRIPTVFGAVADRLKTVKMV